MSARIQSFHERFILYRSNGGVFPDHPRINLTLRTAHEVNYESDLRRLRIGRTIITDLPDTGAA